MVGLRGGCGSGGLGPDGLGNGLRGAIRGPPVSGSGITLLSLSREVSSVDVWEWIFTTSWSSGGVQFDDDGSGGSGCGAAPGDCGAGEAAVSGDGLDALGGSADSGVGSLSPTRWLGYGDRVGGGANDPNGYVVGVAGCSEGSGRCSTGSCVTGVGYLFDRLGAIAGHSCDGQDGLAAAGGRIPSASEGDSRG